jgi:molybdate transport system substrate-binding protein
VDGAPADVFVSASPHWIDFLRERHALGGDPVLFAGNALVAVAPNGSGLASRGVRDAASLLAKGLAPGDRVAIADAGVPAGEYARQSLARLGLLAGYEPLLVGQKDVRAVLHGVEAGEMRAGFVYASDARVAKVETLFVLPADSHDPIQYLAAVVKQTRSPAAAQRFVAFLEGPVARDVLSAAGFTPP